MAIKTVSRSSGTARRTTVALAAAGIALLGGLAGGLTLRHLGAQHSTATTAAVSRPAAETMGGYAEYLTVYSATRARHANNSVAPIGGIAERLRDQGDAQASALQVAERPLGGYAEYLRDQPAADAAATTTLGTTANSSSLQMALSPGLGGDGRPMGGYAEWLLFQTQ